MQRHPGARGGGDDDGDVGYVRSLLSSDSLCQQYVSPSIPPYSLLPSSTKLSRGKLEIN